MTKPQLSPSVQSLYDQVSYIGSSNLFTTEAEEFRNTLDLLLKEHRMQILHEHGIELPCTHESWEIISEHHDGPRIIQSRRCADCKDWLPKLVTNGKETPPSLPDSAVSAEELAFRLLTGKEHLAPHQARQLLTELRNNTIAETEKIARRVISPLHHLPTLQMVIDHLRAERDDPDLEWVGCSPQWLRDGGNCEIAPRRAHPNDPWASHQHPAHAESEG